MNKSLRRNMYRVFCLFSLLVGIYLVIDLLVSGTPDIKMIIVFVFLTAMILWVAAEWKLTNYILSQQEKELKLYEHYIQPLEELVKEIRARQHEYDNQINAILNMHLTVDNYEELVERQSAYIREVRSDGGVNQYLPLLRISDKVLAGFLYSKIVSAPEQTSTDVEVRNWQILSGISEHLLIEVVGVLVDNAYEACGEVRNADPGTAEYKVRMSLDSDGDRMIFEIWNQHPVVGLEEIGHFFEAGYTTKETDTRKRGLGLSRAKRIVEQSGGEILVGQEEYDGENYIRFSVTV